MGGQRAQAEFRQADKGLLQMSVVRHRRRMIKGMAKVQIFHNKYWNSSVNAVRIAEELGVEFEEINYIKTPPDAESLRAIIAKLEDPPTALVRRDSKFKKLELGEDDVSTDDQVVDILVKHKQLLQRPLIVTEDTAIIGRPKDRVRALLS